MSVMRRNKNGEVEANNNLISLRQHIEGRKFTKLSHKNFPPLNR